MDKIIYILILIILENNFYKDIKNTNPINYDFVVNKNYKLDENYVPTDLEQINLEYSCDNKYLRKEARINFENMAKKAKSENLNIIAVSAYRSYKYQEKLKNLHIIGKTNSSGKITLIKDGLEETMPIKGYEHLKDD